MFRPRLAVSTTLPSLVVSWLQSPLQPVTVTSQLPQFLICKWTTSWGCLFYFSKLVQIQCCPPFPCSFSLGTPYTPADISLSTWDPRSLAPVQRAPLGSPGVRLVSCLLGPRPGPGLSTSSGRVPEVEWLGLGSRGFGALWQAGRRKGACGN